jgi:EPS-associated MarR family transcriptional regulator
MIERTSSSVMQTTDAADAEGVPSTHLHLLNLIEQHPEYSQRRLAQALGVSLGKTHYLLKALFDKGLVKAGKFRASTDKLNYLYRVTPTGVRHRLQLTQRFLSQKEREFELLRNEIESLRDTLRSSQRSGSNSDAAQ